MHRPLELTELINNRTAEALAAALYFGWESQTDRYEDTYAFTADELRYRRLQRIYALGVNVTYAGE